MSFSPKVYIVQKFSREGEPREVLAVKLTFSAAHDVAKAFAPAKVLFGLADKGLELNVSDHTEHRPECNQLQMKKPSVD